MKFDGFKSESVKTGRLATAEPDRDAIGRGPHVGTISL